MSLPISAPVPEEYAKKYDAQNPSAYGEHQLATGPYYVTSYQPGKEILLERNPNWDASTDYRPAYLDKIDFQEGFSDTVSAGKKILTGSDQANGDFSSEPETLKLAATQYPDQMQITPSGGLRYVAMNTSKPPFDDVNVRKAVVAGADREAMIATRGGPLAGTVGNALHPAGRAGIRGGRRHRRTGPRLPQEPEGRHEPGRVVHEEGRLLERQVRGQRLLVSIVSDNSPPGSNTSQVVKDELTQLGFNVNLQPVNHDVMYTKFCNVPKNTPNVCPNVAWGKDFNDAQSLLDPTFNGDAIVPSNNSNWPLLNDKAVNKALNDARLVPDPSQRAQTYGKIDDQISALAPSIPWIWDNFDNIESSNVAGVTNLFNASWDVTFTSLDNP